MQAFFRFHQRLGPRHSQRHAAKREAAQEQDGEPEQNADSRIASGGSRGALAKRASPTGVGGVSIAGSRLHHDITDRNGHERGTSSDDITQAPGKEKSSTHGRNALTPSGEPGAEATGGNTFAFLPAPTLPARHR